MTKVKPIAALSETTLRQAVDDATWKRGVSYHRNGHVLDIDESEDGKRIIGRVGGNRVYRCELTPRRGGDVLCMCSCPVGDDGVFCKHGVALGLAYLEQRQEEDDTEDQPTKPRKAGRSQAATVRRYLEALPADELVKLLVERVHQDAGFKRALLQKAAMSTDQDIDPRQVRQAIKQATKVSGYLEYHELGDYLTGLDAMTEGLQQMVRDGHARQALDHIEYAINRCEDAMEHVPDENGEVMAVIERLAELHHAATAADPPDPAELAGKLFEFEMTGSWGAFHNAAERYREVLGAEGLAEYGRLAAQHLAMLPPPRVRKPGHWGTEADHERRTVSGVLVTLARLTGDVDAVIHAKVAAIEDPRDYLGVAKVCIEADRLAEAARWLDQGLSACDAGDHAAEALRTALAQVYLVAGRHDEALQLYWRSFTENPDEHRFVALRDAVRSVKAKPRPDWSAWESKALDHARQTWLLPKVKHKSARRNVMIRLLLAAERPDEAWDEARKVDCGLELWLELARLREKKHPGEALAVYQEAVPRLVEQTDQRSYDKAVDLIERSAKLWPRAESREPFARYLATLRTHYKRKRNFIKALDAWRR